MRKLAFDLGTKTCGFAITDSMSLIANSLETIYFADQDFVPVFKKVSQFLVQYSDIDAFVVGYPLRSNGTKSERTIMMEKFALDLKKKFNINVYLVNEYGSTIKAENTLKSSKISAKKRKALKDTVSAVIILQEFLEYGGIKI
ncbi:hypothetical protein MCAL160_0197 [Mycoplasmopsis californica HAZ160_1]|uniref:Putative pre-16S rRNA nuclease n=1 Tax=Mycoplasmopsis californica HAZ160_1 TaxID=1397850 RepID=A0AAT9F7M7_9BACT|nr:Holliday junction resolvase RuvX [Mycoplasmopsis californica]BAP00893.1 hypothetical protein MCAL160_0197 [Mycoplasmopsis californica HAZ160_1]BBG40752.1 hypothetical protein MCAL106_0197 [Mycoplasmopsis californica]BBG41346.1 hypothetical protein MCAL106E_0197 [Mycoplasmopsis californica]BBG41939.1 hypothetical protein MCAL106L_0197 [Mycoplasmopsis californica]BBG42529.1 hypothetical protein MCAL160E_0197 [Mycoplasmopsis californica]